MTETPTQSIKSYFKPYAIPHYITHAENVVKWLEDDGFVIQRVQPDRQDDGVPSITDALGWLWHSQGELEWKYSHGPQEPECWKIRQPVYATPPVRGDQEHFYTILSKYFPKDATFDNLWQELKEEGLVR